MDESIDVIKEEIKKNRNLGDLLYNSEQIYGITEPYPGRGYEVCYESKKLVVYCSKHRDKVKIYSK